MSLYFLQWYICNCSTQYLNTHLKFLLTCADKTAGVKYSVFIEMACRFSLIFFKYIMFSLGCILVLSYRIWLIGLCYGNIQGHIKGIPVSVVSYTSANKHDSKMTVMEFILYEKIIYTLIEFKKKSFHLSHFYNPGWKIWAAFWSLNLWYKIKLN